MKIKLRDGSFVENSGDRQEKLLSLLYGSAAGRALLKPLTAPIVSRAAGALLDTRASTVLIEPFIRSNGIDMADYEDVEYKSYNQFFSRRIRPGARDTDMDEKHLISPCDSKLTVLPVTKDGRFSIKHTEYSLASLLDNRCLAAEYMGGQLLIFRLCVDDYHRYCYVCDGERGPQRRINGRLHTVNPIANDYFPIYKENTREYCTVKSPVFGDVLMMEVGALLVGRIVNHPTERYVRRGQEKGLFRFGGSTVILLLKKDAALIDEDILENSAQGCETVVRIGEKIGIAL